MSEGPPSESFDCNHCRRTVPLVSHGTKHRNHCPWCLWSLHVARSRTQHDRESSCHGPMAPIAIAVDEGGEWSLVHRCQTCGEVRTNRVAGDDETISLLCLALRPLAKLPFPIDSVPLEYQDRFRKFDRPPD